MYTKTVYFKNYSKASSLPVLLYDASKQYKPFVKGYMHVLSKSIHRMEDGGTSRYKNILEDVNFGKYYDLDNRLVQQTLYGYMCEELSNEQWFRLLKSVIINYKILVIALEHVDYNNFYSKYDMHKLNSGFLSENLHWGTIGVRRKYIDYLPSDGGSFAWPRMLVDILEDFSVKIKLADDYLDTYSDDGYDNWGGIPSDEEDYEKACTSSDEDSSDEECSNEDCYETASDFK